MEVQVLPCEAFEVWYGAAPQHFLPVSDINGFTDLRSLYASEFFQSLPFE
ncbi:hypothetical protein JL2886_01259 [Phaeobacter gallaeciensis]|nr:hypothetical protein JL2886_01259 [Phaeobacter gallaeciensis]